MRTHWLIRYRGGSPERSSSIRCLTSCIILGTSVEDGRVLNRLDEVRKVPAAIRFVSLEPLIGSVAAGDLSGIHWAIVGGESGPKARPMNAQWVDEIET